MKKIAIAIGLILIVLAIFFYFIPAFQGEISVSPVIDLGPVVIRWYGLIMAASILTGFFVARKYSWRFGIDASEVDNLTFWLTIVGILGARLYYVIFAFDHFLARPNEIYKIWHGGLSIYGGLIAGIIFILFYVKRKAYNKYQVFDMLALSLPLAQAVGRFGNFFNQEAFGSPTDLPWKMFVSVNNRPTGFSESSFFHPTFLYEAILSLAIFFVLSRFVGKAKSGILTFGYLGLYSLGRFLIEPLRMDSVFVYGFRADQVVAFIFVVISTIAVIKLSTVEKRT